MAGTALIAVFAFIGFEHLVNVAEELKEPNRTLPRALFLTLGLTALLYALVVWIAVVAVPPQELARSSAPLALVFERLTGMPLVSMSAIAVVATLNGLIVHMIMIARVIYGLADQGNLPRGLYKTELGDAYTYSRNSDWCLRDSRARVGCSACRPRGSDGAAYASGVLPRKSRVNRHQA